MVEFHFSYVNHANFILSLVIQFRSLNYSLALLFKHLAANSNPNFILHSVCIFLVSIWPSCLLLHSVWFVDSISIPEFNVLNCWISINQANKPELNWKQASWKQTTHTLDKISSSIAVSLIHQAGFIQFKLNSTISINSIKLKTFNLLI